MANNLQCLSTILISLVMGSSSALAFDNYKEFRRDRWDFELGTNFFYSEANYEKFGEGTTNLTSGNHYQLLDLDFSTRYMPSKSWSVFAMVSMASSESKSSVATRTNTSLTDVAGGFDFIMYDGVLQLVPELGVVVPLQEVNGTGDESLNSEGVFETWGRVTAQKDFGTARLHGWIGYDYRADGRSSVMPWGGGLQLKANSFRFGGEVIGSQTISDDKDKSTRYVRVAYLQSVNAGSYKFYMVNPTSIDTLFYATWNVDPKWSLQVNGGATVAGENTAAGYHIGGFIRYSFDLTEGYRQEPYMAPAASPSRRSSPTPSGRSNMYDRSDTEMSAKSTRKFREATEDGVDQQQFKPRPTKKAQPKPEVNIQNELDKTEFEVELKRGGH
ncbi:hypothetical protein B9G69_006210 [Bdellovibrio sp. SKB1291214]|uniref:hypothetical protein n=1 Tax=Bdellovibrio sp. SKB1291214 TaxID=1732569 RepID=UPI0020CC81F2|nr:hypothetical protein [Bdellovibrio sp. SKB1291214]UYL10171.1 hypothetical protein B9G69_006210 [Bdellovibrio sp. SKB1291214]